MQNPSKGLSTRRAWFPGDDTRHPIPDIQHSAILSLQFLLSIQFIWKMIRLIENGSTIASQGSDEIFNEHRPFLVLFIKRHVD